MGFTPSSHENTTHEPRYWKNSLDNRADGFPRRGVSKLQRRSTRKLKLFDPSLVKMATRRSFIMLNPASMARNPVMFLVEIGWVLTSIVVVQSVVNHEASLGLSRLSNRPCRCSCSC